MGTADLVPGISGGTVAFIMGVYSELLEGIASLNIQAVKNLCFFRFRSFFSVVAWQFLAPLFFGIFLAIIAFSSLIDSLLNEPTSRTYLFAGFMGLIGGSVVHCMHRVKSWKTPQWTALCIGLVIAFFITGLKGKETISQPTYSAKIELPFQTQSISLKNYDKENGFLKNLSQKEIYHLVQKKSLTHDTRILEQKTGIWIPVESLLKNSSFQFWNGWILLCGILGAMAMILPGISGSYMVTILGTYPIIIAALSDASGIVIGNAVSLTSVFTLGNLFIGIALGLALFSRIIQWLLNHFRDTTLSVLIGFMVGALRAVWPFWKSEFYVDPLHLAKGVRLLPTSPYLPEFSSTLLITSVVITITSLIITLCIDRYTVRHT